MRWNVASGLSMLAAIAWVAPLPLACSAANDAAGGACGNPSPGDNGTPCSASGGCTSAVCLGIGSNFENVQGLCSQGCSSSADCGSCGACLPDPTGTFATACFRKCSSASDCLGVPCVWLAEAGSGVCIPIATGICAAGGTAGCTACAANACCNEYQLCLTSVTCGKDLASCATGACLTKLETSGDSSESALGACLASACAGSCP